MQKLLATFSFIIISIHSFAQREEFIRSKEGAPIFNKKQFIFNLLRSLNKDKSDATALAICECQAQKFDWHFTKKQYKDNTTDGIVKLDNLLKEDSAFQKQINACYTNSDKTYLLQAEGFEEKFIKNCVNRIKENTDKKLDSNRLVSFCSCQLDLIKTKKMTDAEFESANDPNSVLFFEMIYKCGDPFMDDKTIETNWSIKSLNDILGPATDTINILTIHGMTYLKVKIGSVPHVWLFDTGASVLLITKEMEDALKKENIITDANYLGIGDYEMANGVVDTCRKYNISNVQIGNFKVNNIVVAVTNKGKRIIVGKTLLNKFSNWTLNNKENTLILTK